MPKIRFELQVVTAYLILGGLWIIFSDRILKNLISDINVLSDFQTYKGWFYVIVTAVLFYVILNRHLKKLRQAEHDAKESDRLKTAFLQNISHEIRTPMNGIMGFSQLLESENLTSDQSKEYTSIINSSSKRLLSVVNDILEISMLESGKIRLYESNFDLNEMLSELNESVKMQVHPNVELTFKASLSCPLSIIRADKEKLQKVMYNLLDNAIKFTESGSIYFGYDFEDQKLIFFVSDTGIGIDQKSYKLIFDSFRKTERNNERMYEGMGLGLAICKGMLNVMGGNIWVESVPGQGSTFYFSLPYKKCEISTANENLLEKATLKQKKVLVVEDDESSFEFIKTILNKENFVILHAWNGMDGITLYKENRDIDLIILDIKLPGMSGYEVLRTIRETDTHIPVIAQTAFVLEEERKKAIDSGFDEFLAKPYKKDDLLKRINLLHSKN